MCWLGALWQPLYYPHLLSKRNQVWSIVLIPVRCCCVAFYPCNCLWMLRRQLCGTDGSFLLLLRKHLCYCATGMLLGSECEDASDSIVYVEICNYISDSGSWWIRSGLFVLGLTLSCFHHIPLTFSFQYHRSKLQIWFFRISTYRSRLSLEHQFFYSLTQLVTSGKFRSSLDFLSKQIRAVLFFPPVHLVSLL